MIFFIFFTPIQSVLHFTCKSSNTTPVIIHFTTNTTPYNLCFPLQSNQIPDSTNTKSINITPQTQYCITADSNHGFCTACLPTLSIESQICVCKQSESVQLRVYGNSNWAYCSYSNI
jgi:hypothetical protein